jgi:alanyl-tRNA synthetase
MGDGPCGPCTEIFFDFSPFDGLSQKITDLESKRFLEIGNIVFSEYYHQEEKNDDNKIKYLPLTRKCVDFGGGLERIAMILQNKKSSFEIDY